MSIYLHRGVGARRGVGAYYCTAYRGTGRERERTVSVGGGSTPENLNALGTKWLIKLTNGMSNPQVVLAHTGYKSSHTHLISILWLQDLLS